MKAQTLKFSLIFLVITLTAACSNQEYDRYIEKGLDHLGEKEYHQAAVQFERALQLQEGDRTAAAYYHQANQMDNALEEYRQKDYDSALESLEAVIARKNGLKTIEQEAVQLTSRIMDTLNQTSEIEEEITLIKSLLANESFNTAQDKLKELQAKLEQDEGLAVYQPKVQQFLEDADKGLRAMETEVNEEQPKKEQNEEKDKSEVTKKEETSQTREDPPPKEAISYQTYHNERFGFSLQYPEGWVMEPPPTNGDGATFKNGEATLIAYGGHTNIVQQGETIETYYETELEGIEAEIAYQRLGDDWYVVSYESAGTIYYNKFFFDESTFNSFRVSYPASKQSIYGPVTTHIAENFRSAAY
ncbi:MAG: hypothetical protein ACQEUT_02030 [Bacillota bacterium]